MRLKLPTIDIKIGSREVDVQPPDVNGTRKDLSGKASDLRDVATSGASSLMDAAASGASTIRDAAVDAASSIRDIASDRASDIKDRAPDVNLPEVKLPSVDLPGIDVAKAVAPAAKAVGDGIEAVAESFRSVRKGIDTWRNPPKQPPFAEAGVALLAGVGGGMALMFFMDPKLGRRRRALLMDKLGRWSRQAGETIQGLSKDMANRTQGLTAEVGSAGRDMADAAEQHAAVLDTPDASGKLEEIDRAAGHATGTQPTTAYDTVATTGAMGSSEIYGQSWGETQPASQEVGSFADTEIPAEERDRIGSA